MKNIFDIVNHISSNKNDISDQIGVELRNIYGQFMVNRILSCSPDTLYLADVANELDVKDEVHYLFWHNVINKRKRYFKYPKNKKTDNDNVNLISKYYNVSKEKATEMVELLSEEQMKYIAESYLNGK